MNDKFFQFYNCEFSKCSTCKKNPNCQLPGTSRECRSLQILTIIITFFLANVMNYT